MLRESVECLAIALSELGIHKGDKIGIASENRIEWIVADFAIVSLGAVDVPIFPILTAKQEEYIFSHAEVSAIFVSNDFQLQKVLQFKDKIQSLRHVIVMNDNYNSSEVYVKSIRSLIDRGKQLKSDSARRTWFENTSLNVNPDDLLTIIYTSGTTGEPKGVMLTHNNMVTNIAGVYQYLGDLGEHTALSFLPFCHAYERMAGVYYLFSCGTLVAIAESIESVPANIQEIKPTLISTVPKLMETVRKKIYAAMDKEKSSKKAIFNWAVNIGIKYVKLQMAGKSSFLLRKQYQIADKLVFSKLRERLGGRLRLFITGGAALADEVFFFFMAIGITVLQGYGLTEASPVISITTYDNNEENSIGQPLKNLVVKIAEDGEILARGPNIMRGYFKDPIATAEAINEEGWLHTGDIGMFTEKGNLRITDRKKNIFISSGGKNIAPQPIENLLSQSRFIHHCVLIGEKREYCTALLTCDFEQLRILAEELQVEFQNEDELISNSKILKHIKGDIDFYQKDLSKFEKVRRFQLLSKPFTVDTGELSPKLSIKRHVVESKYSELIAQMYNE